MPATYEKIQSITLSTATSGIEFTSIPSTFTDLRLILFITDVAGNPTAIRLNSDSTSKYSMTFLYGNGANAGSYRNANATSFVVGNQAAAANFPTMNEVDLFSYAGSSRKVILSQEAGDAGGSGLTSAAVGIYNSTSAITTIRIEAGFSGSNLGANSSASLYGIKKV